MCILEKALKRLSVEIWTSEVILVRAYEERGAVQKVFIIWENTYTIVTEMALEM